MTLLPPRVEESEQEPLPEDPKPLVLTGRVNVRSIMLTGIFVLLVFHTLSFARSLLLPIVLALLANLALTPIVRWMANRRVPEPIGAAVLILSLFAGLAFGAASIAGPAAAWMERAPQSLREIERKMRSVKEPLEQASAASEQVAEMAEMGGGTPTARVQLRERNMVEVVLSQTQSVLASAIVWAVLLYFLLASGESFLRKVVSIVPRFRDKREVVTIVRQTERDISRYLFTICTVNAVLGLVVAAAMHQLGMPNPVLWGVLAGILNFIPYLGSMVTATVLTGVALLTFDSVSRALTVPGVFVVITALEGAFITPYLVGRRLLLSPVVVFAGLLMWSWLWGVPGALAAVPLLAVAKILCDRVERLQPIGQLLGR